ncbi:MAG: LysR substrate-binding domain-containing protein, partial [Terriglobales bacterium]
MVELRHLRYFVVLAEELHFSRAAQRLHIAQPGLTQQIKALEEELGVTLLDRNRRRVELTEAGTTLLDEGRRLLAQVDRAVSLTRRAGTGEIGRLTIGAAESAVFDILPSLLREYRKRYPLVDLQVREMPSPAQTAALRSAEIDVGFVRTPVDTEGLIAMTIRAESVGIFVPEAHPLSSSSEIRLEAMFEDPLVIHPGFPRPSWADFCIGLCRTAGFEPIIGQEANESAAAVCFVAAGLGFTLVPESLVTLTRPGVVYRP